jgi:hypothetical protein
MKSRLKFSNVGANDKHPVILNGASRRLSSDRAVKDLSIQTYYKITTRTLFLSTFNSRLSTSSTARLAPPRPCLYPDLP